MTITRRLCGGHACLAKCVGAKLSGPVAIQPVVCALCGEGPTIVVRMDADVWEQLERYAPRRTAT